MRCSQCRTKQTGYERGELAAPERQNVEEHLQACGRCRAFYREMKRLKAALPALEPEAPRRDLWPKVAARVAAKAPRVLAQRMLRPALAGVMLAAAVGLVMSTLTPPPPRALPGSAGAEALVKHSETGTVWIDPWAGPAAQGLDWILAEKPETKLD
jgi:predicted anti-sigma-YlaC factor YlaD